jgi:hypothetical protein
MEKLFSLPLHRLRLLQVYHMNRRYPLEVLAANEALANLTSLRFHPHHHVDLLHDDPPAGPEDGYITLEGVRALVRSPHLPALTHLQLRLSTMGDAGVEEIVRSGILKRLKVLDLRHGCVTDAGARTLAECPDLRRLELLDLDRNRLSPAGVAALQGAGIMVRAGDQVRSDEDVNQYLFEGDFE